MKIPLTPQQVDQLLPYIARVQSAAIRGDPGMLVAQIQRESADSSVYVMEPCFLDHDKALPLVEAGRRLSQLKDNV